MEEVNAIVIESLGKYEVRCAKCGKMLFTYKIPEGKTDSGVDKSSPNAIIVSRCPRSSCKTDNLLVFS